MLIGKGITSLLKPMKGGLMYIIISVITHLAGKNEYFY